MIIYAALGGAILGCILTYLVLKKKLNRHTKLNEEIQRQNQQEYLRQEELRLSRQDLQIAYDKAKRELELKEMEYDKKSIELSGLKNELSLVQNNITTLKEQADESAKVFYEQSISLAEEKLDRALELKAIEVQKNQEEYENIWQKIEDQYRYSFPMYSSPFVFFVLFCF